MSDIKTRVKKSGNTSVEEFESSQQVVEFIRYVTVSTRRTYTGLSGELEHLKIETRLTGESFECVKMLKRFLD